MNRPSKPLQFAILSGLMLFLTGCPIADDETIDTFSVTPAAGLAPLAVTFDVSANATFDLSSCVVAFGDGSEQALEIVGDTTCFDRALEHTYADEGTFTASFTVIGPPSTSGVSVELEVEVGVGPLTASPASGDAPLAVTFRHDDSVELAEVLDSCVLDPGDGSEPINACGATSSHTYGAPGTYTATRTVTEGGKTDSASVEITVSDPTPDEAPSSATNLPTAVDLIEGIVRMGPPGSSCPNLLAAGGGIDGGAGGGAIVNGCSGDLVRGYPIEGLAGSPPWFDANILEVPPGETGDDLLVLTGQAYALRLLDDAGEPFGFTQVNPPGSGPFPDAQLLGGDPTAGALIVEGNRLYLLRYSAAAEAFTTDQTILASDIGSDLVLLTAAADAAGENLLVVADDTTDGTVLLHLQNPPGGPLAVTPVGPLGSEPSRIRCDLDAGFCAISDRTDDTVTAILWDGAGSPTIGSSAAVGALPVGVDVLGRRVVSAGYDDDSFSITLFDAGGEPLSTDTQPTPVGCSQPGHAIFTGAANYAVILSCNGSGSLAYIPEAY